MRPLGENGREARSTVWTVADITRDRERQENIFQELQHAIKGLIGLNTRVVVHAPASLERSVGKAKRVVDRRSTG